MALQLINITKFYKYGKKRQRVIDDLTIKFPSRGMIGIIGQSGTGKSTLLNIIAGIERPCNGQVLIDGHRLNYQQIRMYQRDYISYVYQFYNLVNALTIKENLILITKIKGIDLKQVSGQLEELNCWKDIPMNYRVVKSSELDWFELSCVIHQFF